ncbi:hypothetical protein [Actinoplanes sp. M2I2]|uniref:hypothetical protein n=1 Tax=Actinoplanes sp. M2I2 TaxID=1734444 RepID=UPI0020218943|nr:hypothetical protein [Actinoplanes sp. M2I2]
MTCVNCGSTAIQPNGWCSACGRPASPYPPPDPAAAGWPPAQGEQQSWPPAPAQQQSWPPPQQGQQPSWATDATTTFGVPGQVPSSAPPANAYQQPAAYPPPMDATAVQGYPAYPQGPAGPGFAPPPYPNSPYPAPARAANTFSIIAFVLAGLAVLILPIVLSPLAAILAFVGIRRHERLGRLALILAVVGGLAGAFLGIVFRSLITG